jgi:hypothetical protein
VNATAPTPGIAQGSAQVIACQSGYGFPREDYLRPSNSSVSITIKGEFAEREREGQHQQAYMIYESMFASDVALIR